MWVMNRLTPPLDHEATRTWAFGPSRPRTAGLMTTTGGLGAAERMTTPSGDPIMTAKFLVPAVRPPVVARPRLLERLSTGVLGPLTLVSAPAGSGKTVLASEWATAGGALGPVIWISLDEEDDLPGVFWSYVLAGLVTRGRAARAGSGPRSVPVWGAAASSSAGWRFPSGSTPWTIRCSCAWPRPCQ